MLAHCRCRIKYRDAVKLSSPKDTDGMTYKVVAFNVNWNDDEWNVNANDFDNGNDWNAGNLFLYFDTAVVKTSLDSREVFVLLQRYFSIHLGFFRLLQVSLLFQHSLCLV